jgi:hypothetical protein
MLQLTRPTLPHEIVIVKHAGRFGFIIRKVERRSTLSGEVFIIPYLYKTQALQEEIDILLDDHKAQHGKTCACHLDSFCSFYCAQCVEPRKILFQYYVEIVADRIRGLLEVGCFIDRIRIQGIVQ